MWTQMTINIRWFSNKSNKRTIDTLDIRWFSKKSNKRNCICVDTNDNKHEMVQ